MKKRVWSFIFALIMVVALLPQFQAADVYADDGGWVIELGDVTIVVDTDEVFTERIPEGITYDVDNRVLTLNDYTGAESGLKIYYVGSRANDRITLKLVGYNTLLSVNATSILITGKGILNCQRLYSENFEMDSGTLNIKKTEKRVKEQSDTYGITSEVGYVSEGKVPNSFKILGGEINIDLTEKVTYTDYRGERNYRFVGFDAQSGNVEIRNAKVRIDLGDNEWLGLGIGWLGRGDKPNGGKLTMENGTLEITSSDYQAYFFEFKNEGDPLHYYIGTSGPEKEVSFNEAFEKKTYESSAGGNSISRYERQTEGKGYLLVTNEKVETVEPETPSQEPSDITDDGYTDVPKSGKWYSESVYYATEKGYMAGTGNNKFTPDGTVTRGTIAQILYAAEGKPSVTNDKQFSDVASDQWYAKAVNWAAEKKLVAGYGGGKFGPNDPVTRQQMVAIMYQYAKMKGFDLATSADLSGFRDQNKISTWAVEPMKWAVGHQIISGTGNGIEPNGTATRAQIAVILQAFDKNIRNK